MKHLQHNKDEAVTIGEILDVTEDLENYDDNRNRNEAENKLQVKNVENLKLLACKLTMLMLLLQTTEDKWYPNSKTFSKKSILIKVRV